MKILVIKLGALGDFVQAMGPAAAIRAHHPHDHVTLLTTAPFAALARRTPYFDEVWIDERPRLTALSGLLRLRRRLRGGRFELVYDLQTSARTSWYFQLIGPDPRPPWSGIASGARLRHVNLDRDRMHTLDRQADQLRSTGIDSVPLPDLSWARPDIARFGLAAPFVLLVPGGAAHRPAKRWPVASYAALARRIAAAGVVPVVIGGSDERDLGAAIAAACAACRDLTGATSLEDLVGLGAAARHAIGNDTGPMHVLAASGCALTVLYSRESDPALTQPRGAHVTVLRRDNLDDLTVGEVAATMPLG